MDETNIYKNVYTFYFYTCHEIISTQVMNFLKKKIHPVTKEPTLFPITVFLDSFYCKMLGN